MADVIDLFSYCQERLKRAGREVTIDDFRKFVEMTDEDIEWLSIRFACARFPMFMRCLFYRNHVTSGDVNPNVGFIAGFKEEHMHESQRLVALVLDQIGRRYHIVNADGLTLRGVIHSITGVHPRTASQGYYHIRDLLYETDHVIVIREFSKSKSRISKSGFLHDLVKILDDAHCEDVYPKSDLIFIDYADFLQRGWSELGRYVSALTFSESDMELTF